jgi:hypothetical protein
MFSFQKTIDITLVHVKEEADLDPLSDVQTPVPAFVDLKNQKDIQMIEEEQEEIKAEKDSYDLLSSYAFVQVQQGESASSASVDQEGIKMEEDSHYEPSYTIYLKQEYEEAR